MIARMAKELNREYFQAQGRKGGKAGGALSWEKMTKAERSARAKKASVAGVAARKRNAAARRKAAKKR